MQKLIFLNNEGSVHCLCTAFKPLALLFIQVYQVLGEIQLEVGEVVNVVHTVLLEILAPETNQKHWRNTSYDWHPKLALMSESPTFSL